MEKGISIHIGVGQACDRCKQDFLTNADADARAMQAIADENGFSSTRFVGPGAAKCAVLAEVDRAAHVLESGDILLITFSGHGNQVEDTGLPTHSDTDRVHESWCLANQQLFDVEAYQCLTNFSEGVRIVVISESCYSGGYIGFKMEELYESARAALGTHPKRSLPADMPLSPDEERFAGTLHRARRRRYNVTLPTEVGKEIKASVLLLASSEETKVSVAGVFTQVLLNTWADGRFPGGYLELIKEVARKVKTGQNPGWVPFGKKCSGLLHERPFTIRRLPR